MDGASEHLRHAVGSYLRRLREANGCTLRELAERTSRNGVKTGIARLNRIERGETMPPLDLAQALFRSLGASLGDTEEVLRLAQVGRDVDLSSRSVEELIEEGKEKRFLGFPFESMSLFEAAYDLLLLREASIAPDTLAEVMILRADIYRLLRFYRMARDTIDGVLNMAGISEKLRLHGMLVKISVGYMTGSFFEAGLLAEKAGSMLEDAEPWLRAFGHAVIGNLHFRQNSHGKAIPFLERARRGYQDLALGYQASQVAVFLGYCHCQAKHLEGGRSLIKRAYGEARKKRYPEVAACALRMLGRVDLEKGQAEEAAAYLSKAAEVAHRLGIPEEEFMALFYLRRSEISRGESSRAEKTLGRLRKIMIKVDGMLPERRALTEELNQRGRANR